MGKHERRELAEEPPQDVTPVTMHTEPVAPAPMDVEPVPVPTASLPQREARKELARLEERRQVLKTTPKEALDKDEFSRVKKRMAELKQQLNETT